MIKEYFIFYFLKSNIMKTLLVIILVVVEMTNISNSQTNSFKLKLDSLFSKYDIPNPGAAVEVISHGKVIFQKGYGYANLEEKIPINSQY